ncbi:hypothetical protein [Phascolarctobacterium sp.]|uniref:hypothetical protein n=1 Tax=Phascolarctobacterium sp. TaxID=2049039 RepID=UPI00205D795B|nr:hypothetical protein [Phascolarctobacterium sp.]DAF80136.1 MAG TPA: hypothetical protein [Caudoviricetes sp.]
MRVIRNSDNKLMKGRLKNDDLIAFEACGVFEVRELPKGSKWQEANINDFRVVKAKTIKCTYVDHSLGNKKTFKAGKRYQVESGRVLGGVAGYVFDEDGDRFTLYREEVGFSAAGCYLFEAKYS